MFSSVQFCSVHFWSLLFRSVQFSSDLFRTVLYSNRPDATLQLTELLQTGLFAQFSQYCMWQKADRLPPFCGIRLSAAVYVGIPNFLPNIPRAFFVISNVRCVVFISPLVNHHLCTALCTLNHILVRYQKLCVSVNL